MRNSELKWSVYVVKCLFLSPVLNLIYRVVAQDLVRKCSENAAICTSSSRKVGLILVRM